jgi:UDP-N-acetylmuramoyl-L-alanyl-D-glutamate--2,6-diaminopimelate ligase
MSTGAAVRTMPLSTLLGSAAGNAVAVSDLTLDSRAVQPGGAFLACQGRRSHGLSYLETALTRGARAVLWEPAPGVTPPSVPANVSAVAVPQLAARAGELADRFFGAPSRSLRIAGVTGTNGKTTCAWLLAQALTASGRLCGYIGTLGAGMPGAVLASEHTTADAVTVHRQLAELRSAGASCVAMEVSSHALDQHRVVGVRFRVAAFTNLTRDHLDYHGDMAAYAEAKARLFDLPELDWRVINIDDEFGMRLHASAQGQSRLLATSRSGARLAQADAWLTATRVALASDGIDMDLESSAGRTSLHVPLLGEFNADNVLTVLGVLLALDLPLSEAAALLAKVTPPSGRMETFGGGEAPLVIVDYAHTPDALEKALAAARTHCRGHLTVVFGCGGDRDAGKRPQMGAVAAQLADRIVLTDDNPRSEDPAQIVAGIRRGMPINCPVQTEHDRARAIQIGIEASRPGDVVLVAGKGHEDYQIVAAIKRPFSDQAEVRAALSARTASVRRQ